MTTVWEAQTLDNVQTEEAKRHNEMIRERYRQLQNAEEIQLSETFSDAEQAKEIAPSARRAGCARYSRACGARKNGRTQRKRFATAARTLHRRYVPPRAFR